MLRTDRLLLRELSADDVDAVHALHNDPVVMRYLTGGTAIARDVIEHETLPTFLGHRQRCPGYGYWAAIGRSSGEFLGWLALCPPESGDADVPELGYRLRRAAWGNGYATEGARALIDLGFGRLGARRVFAQTMAVNLGSRRVMEKSGLRHVRTFHEEFDDPLPGTEFGEVEYALDRADWLARRDGPPSGR